MGLTLGIVIGYLVLLLGLGVLSGRYFKGTAKDYFVASRSIGSFLLLMSIFGTTMTAFALVGSTGKAYTNGIGVYGLMASWSGLIHSAVFFLVGIRLWAIGKRHGFVTQCEYFRDRFDSPALGYLLFPILVALVIPYLLVGIIGANRVIGGITRGAFPEAFAATGGSIPPWLTGLVICAVVLTYVFLGGLRGAAWANAFQTIVFLTMGIVAFWLIASSLGGFEAASAKVLEVSPRHLAREGMIGRMEFISYCFVPLSVGMFPHLFQHWMTAREARTFRLTVVLHPVFIMVLWVPCILIGIWAVGAGVKVPPMEAGKVLGIMVAKLQSPIVSGLIAAGILAAIMSSLDSQFLCLGTMFTNDFVVRIFGTERFTDRHRVLLARGFIVAIVTVTYLLSNTEPRRVFDLGVWCFSGFAGLFPLPVAAIYWRRTTAAGAFAGILAAAASWTVLFIRSDYGAHEGLVGGLMPVAWIVLSATAALIVVSLLTKPPADATIARYFSTGKA